MYLVSAGAALSRPKRSSTDMLMLFLISNAARDNMAYMSRSTASRPPDL